MNKTAVRLLALAAGLLALAAGWPDLRGGGRMRSGCSWARSAAARRR